MTEFAIDHEITRAVADALAPDFGRVVNLVAAQLIGHGHDLSPFELGDETKSRARGQLDAFYAPTPALAFGRALSIFPSIGVTGFRFGSTTLKGESPPERPAATADWSPFNRRVFESRPFGEFAKELSDAIQKEMVTRLWSRTHQIARSMDVAGDPLCTRGVLDYGELVLLHFCAFDRGFGFGLMFLVGITEQSFKSGALAPPSK